jgi:hypothetical protein
MEDGLEQNRSMLSNQEGKILENKMSQLTINKDKNHIQSNSHVKYQSLKKSNCEEPLSWSFRDSELAQSQR